LDNWDVWAGAIALILLAGQMPASAILLSRLLQGPRRIPPLRPQGSLPEQQVQVSVVVPTLNEADRLKPCLVGLSQQGDELREVIVVDSHSQDGTGDLVKMAQSQDPRFRLIYDDPLPAGWVGRPWALHTGFLSSSKQSEWILGIDADTRPRPGLIASLIQTAQQENYDLISLAPQFILQGIGEFWLQPALLITLVYRFGPAGGDATGPERVMANGQCFLCRRSLLARLGGYTTARSSFCDDVTLARYAASQGARVGFLDGAQLLQVRMYEGMAETWREWGRSLDLKDAASVGQKWGDFAFLLAVQGGPILLLPILSIWLLVGQATWPVWLAWGLNAALVVMRWALLGAIAPSYDFSSTQTHWAYWFSPFADPLAVWRIFLSSIQTPTQWRGRSYPPVQMLEDASTLSCLPKEE
jgi:dolichol-phosphate mannosyltransferase